MKRVLLLLLAGVRCVGLAACGGGFAGYDPETTAQALLDSGAFEDALDTLDEESACMVYGLDPEQVEDCVVYASITAGAEGWSRWRIPWPTGPPPRPTRACGWTCTTRWSGWTSKNRR